MTKFLPLLLEPNASLTRDHEREAKSRLFNTSSYKSGKMIIASSRKTLRSIQVGSGGVRAVDFNRRMNAEIGTLSTNYLLARSTKM
jgi:hypothetical protein